MRFKDHCLESERTFGKRYEEVHHWLDEFASNYSFFDPDRYKHRKHRHHQEGVEEARAIFGDIAALVAEQHIRSDNEGYLPERREYDIPEYQD